MTSSNPLSRLSSPSVFAFGGGVKRGVKSGVRRVCRGWQEAAGRETTQPHAPWKRREAEGFATSCLLVPLLAESGVARRVGFVTILVCVGKKRGSATKRLKKRPTGAGVDLRRASYRVADTPARSGAMVSPRCGQCHTGQMPCRHLPGKCSPPSTGPPTACQTGLGGGRVGPSGGRHVPV